MLRQAITTPCLVNTPFDSVLSNSFDHTTTNLEYTTDFRTSVRNVKPRRRQRQSTQITIHEDEDGENLSLDAACSLMLSHPPRRVKPVRKTQDGHVEHTSRQKTSNSESTTSETLPRLRMSRLGQASTRSIPRLSALPESPVKGTEPHLELPLPQPSRPPRRGTIFIPNDDTTMPSMYMGIFSPIKNFNSQAPQTEEKESNVEFTGIAAQMAARRGPRKSAIDVAPRRAPLQLRVCPTQEGSFVEDRYGQGGGKENVPPGMPEKSKEGLSSLQKITRPAPRRASAISQSLVGNDRISLHATTTSATAKHESARASEVKKLGTKPAWNGGSRTRQSRPASVLRKAPKPPSPTTAAPNDPGAQPYVPTRFVIPAVHVGLPPSNHIVISDDISDPAMYEDDWLRHQEIAITQLVNSLFSAPKLRSQTEPQPLISQLLKVYNTSTLSLMHKRLQAALFYGSLSIPQDILENGTRLQNDIGLKKSFTDLWLSNYSPLALEAGLEVVIGRRCKVQRSHTSGGSSSSPNVSKSELRTFIELYLICNKDAKPDQEVKNRMHWSYQRTVLRSLMLVKALDLIKTEKSVHMSANLFQNSAIFKSSVSMVQALVQMLNPAVGDPVRALSHITYEVSHIQSPLEETDFQIHNLAVDLRDGVRLTRIVELLLYPSASETLEKHYDVDNTTTFLVSEGDSVEFVIGQNWPLSQHLRTTCQSRAVRLWNVELALAAVRNVKDIASLIEGITADDIVDGFREKTIRLLWALVGKWGLVGLLNWQDLRWETKRLHNLCAGDRRINGLYDDNVSGDPSSFETCRSTLREWARAVAAHRGITIRNFTTSFADGKVFETIVDVYEPLIQPEVLPHTKTMSLQQRLIRLGCSTQFSQLFAVTEESHIFDRDFVLAALAFLCSRLLAPTRHTRAAVVVQNAWRRRWTRVEEVRKQEKRRVAAACAQIIQTKHSHRHNINQDIGMSDDLTMAASGFDQTAETHNPSDECPWSMSPLPTPGEEDIWLTL